MKGLEHGDVESLTLRTLERIAFVLADPVKELETSFQHHTRIAFSGNGESSQLQLSATDGFLTEFVSSLLGLEPEEVQPGSDGLLALNELANIIAGEVIAKLGGGEVQFELGLPGVVETHDLSSREADVRCLFAVEDGYLEVAIHREATGSELS